MKIAAAQAERFCASPGADIPVVLVFGPDEGLVRERVEKLIAGVLDDPKDPFRLTDIQGDQVRADPALLVDEARSLCLVGGRRVVRVRQAGDQITAPCKALLALSVIDALVVIEGGELPAASSLRKLMEAASNAAAVACYRDEGRDLAALIDRSLGGIRLDPDARAYLIEHLGGDRAVTRAELAKLALYLDSPPGEAAASVVSLQDVAAVIGDSAALGLDDLADAATCGDVLQVDRCLSRLLGEGQAPVRLIRSMIMHLHRLRRLALQAKDGRSIDQVVDQARPPIHFRRKNAIRSALRRWKVEGLGHALAALLEAEIACKTTGRPAALLCREAIFSLCVHPSSEPGGSPKKNLIAREGLSRPTYSGLQGRR